MINFCLLLAGIALFKSFKLATLQPKKKPKFSTEPSKFELNLKFSLVFDDIISVSRF